MAASRCWRVPCFHIYHSFITSLLHFAILLSAYNISDPLLPPPPPPLHNNSLNDNQLTIHQSSNHSLTELTPSSKDRDSSAGDVNFQTMVFLVGFHKCGTRTTANFFMTNGFPAVHNNNFNGHRVRNGEPTLRQVMQENYYHDRPVLYSLANRYMFFSDYGTFPRRKPGSTGRVPPWYQLIASQYPETNQLYILQIRDVHKWLHSRYTHYHSNIGFFIDRMREQKERVFVNDTEYILSEYDEETQDILILQQWEIDWYDYMCELWTYFNNGEGKRDQKDQNRNNGHIQNLLLFDIERDDPVEIVDFGRKHGLTLNISHWEHRGNTKDKLRSKRIQKQFAKWDAIVQRMPQFERTDVNFATETQRIMHQCLRRMWAKKEKECSPSPSVES